MKPKSANGVDGILIQMWGGGYVFRVYDDDHNFVDYDLLHTDLSITITDEDAFFYRDEFQDTLDHSPETLEHKE